MSTVLHNLLERWYAPTICLTFTEEVNRLALKNNLNLEDLLKPFTNLENINVPLRTVSGTTIIKGIKFRIVNQSLMKAPNVSEVETTLSTVVTAEAPTLEETLDIYNDTINTIDEVREATTSKWGKERYSLAAKPWYLTYRHSLVDGMRYFEHELFDAPVGMMYFVSSSNSDIVACFDELQSAYHLPENFSKGVYDNKIPHILILLHDVREAGSVETEKMLKKMQSSYPSAICRILPINSLPSPRATNSGGGKNIWETSIRLNRIPTSLMTTKESATPASTNSNLGCFLSDEDVKRIASLFQEVIVKGIIPSLEHRMNDINASVTEKRKGLRNAFKSWWRKPKEKETVKSNEALYHHSSIESQIRYLADLNFMLKDYEQAQSLYRLVKDDFKADKAWLHHASANEMIALCLFMLDGTYRGEIESLLETAYQNYKQSSEEEARGSEKSLLAKRLATRSIFLSVDIMLYCTNNSQQLRSAANMLLKVSSEENSLCAALLLEQSATCFLHITPVALFRKYGFHLIMAGHLFHKSGNKFNAVRCYAAAAGVYRSLDWFHVDDHINLTLGRQLYALNDAESAIRFFLKLIGTGRQPAERQNVFLREFLTIVKSWGAVGGVPSQTQKEIKDLVLPRVLDDSIQINDLENAASIVESGQQHQYSKNDDFVSTSPRLWEELDKDTCDKVDAYKRGKWHVVWEPPLKSKRIIGKMPVVTRVAGEPILLDVSIENPLAIKVELQDIQLYGELDTEVIDPVKDAENISNKREALMKAENINIKNISTHFSTLPPPISPSGASGSITESLRRLSSSTTPVTPPNIRKSVIANLSSISEKDEESTTNNLALNFVVEPIQLVLAPTSKKVVRLSVTPKCNGNLNIRGICWKLFGEVWGRHDFILKGDPLNDTREHRASRVRSVDTRLQAKVVSNMPWLGVQFNDLPLSILEGQIVKASVTLKNYGVSPLSNLIVNVSSYALIFGTSKGIDFNAFSSEFNVNEEKSILCPSIGANGTLFQLVSPSSKLEPGGILTLPVWVKGIGEETQTINMIFRYETLNKALISRDLKYTIHLAVAPSLMVETFPLASHSEVGTYLLGVSVTNIREDNQSIDFKQCSILSSVWSASCIPPPSSNFTSTIQPRETLTMYFKFNDLKIYPHKSKQELVSSDMNINQINNIVIPSVSPVIFSFLKMENANDLISTEHKKELSLLAAAEASQNSYHPEALSEGIPRHCEKEALYFHKQEYHCMILWGSKESETSGFQQVNGQTNLINEKLRKKIMYQSMNNDDFRRTRTGSLLSDNINKPTPSLILTISHPSSYLLPSNEALLGIVPITINIQNGAPKGSKAISFIFDIIKEEANKGLPKFTFTGMTRQLFKNVEAGDLITFTLKACFIEKGIFDLNRFKCTILPPINTTSISPIVQTFNMQNLIHVQSDFVVESTSSIEKDIVDYIDGKVNEEMEILMEEEEVRSPTHNSMFDSILLEPSTISQVTLAVAGNDIEETRATDTLQIDTTSVHLDEGSLVEVNNSIDTSNIEGEGGKDSIEVVGEKESDSHIDVAGDDL